MRHITRDRKCRMRLLSVSRINFANRSLAESGGPDPQANESSDRLAVCASPRLVHSLWWSRLESNQHSLSVEFTVRWARQCPAAPLAEDRGLDPQTLSGSIRFRSGAGLLPSSSSLLITRATKNPVSGRFRVKNIRCAKSLPHKQKPPTAKRGRI